MCLSCIRPFLLDRSQKSGRRISTTHLENPEFMASTVALALSWMASVSESGRTSSERGTADEASNLHRRPPLTPPPPRRQRNRPRLVARGAGARRSNCETAGPPPGQLARPHWAVSQHVSVPYAPPRRPSRAVLPAASYPFISLELQTCPHESTLSNTLRSVGIQSVSVCETVPHEVCRLPSVVCRSEKRLATKSGESKRESPSSVRGHQVPRRAGRQSKSLPH